jgi:DNA topoisomerase-2
MWRAANPDGMKGVRVSYLKGLGSSSKTVVPLLAHEFNKRILHFIPNPNSHKLLDDFYGNDSDPRKKYLRTPLDQEWFPKPRQAMTQLYNHKLGKWEQIPVNYVDAAQYVAYHAKEFSIDNLKRMLPGIDGLNESRRKVLATVRKLPASIWRKPMKTATLAGFVTADMGYAHGEASLVQTIYGMCQYYPGARVVPFMVPDGMFGSRGTRGVDTEENEIKKNKGASPRYTHTRPVNEFLWTIYPPEDDIHLVYDEDQGDYFEPRYYNPIDCMAVTEYCSNPATGWKVDLYPRAHKERIENIKIMIKDGVNAQMVYMPPNLNGFIGRHVTDFESPGAPEYMIGIYQYNDIMVKIIELPINISPTTYCRTIDHAFGPNGLNILRDDLGDSKIQNNSTNSINILIYLKVGWLSKLTREPPSPCIDKIAYNLYLVEKMCHCINIMHVDNSVREYTNYMEPMKEWFVLRDELWRVRIERILIKLRCEKIEIENKIRFLSEYKDLKIEKVKKTRAVEILDDAKYKRIDHVLLARKNCRLSNADFDRLLYTIKNVENDVDDDDDKDRDDDPMGTKTPGAKFDYLLSMRFSSALEENIKKLEQLLLDIIARIEMYSEPSYYKKLWVEQLDKLYDYYVRRDEIVLSYLPRVTAEMMSSASS